MANESSTKQGKTEHADPVNAEERRRDEAVKQAHSQALSPEEKHQAYLDDLERLHNEP